MSHASYKSLVKTLRFGFLLSLMLWLVVASPARAEDVFTYETKGKTRPVLGRLPQILPLNKIRKRIWDGRRIAIKKIREVSPVNGHGQAVGQTNLAEPKPAMAAANQVGPQSNEAIHLAAASSAKKKTDSSSATASDAIPIGVGIIAGWKTYDLVRKRKEDSDGEESAAEESKPKPSAKPQPKPVKRKVIEQHRTIEEETYAYPVQVESEEVEIVKERVLEARVDVTNVPKMVTKWITEKIPVVKKVAKTYYDEVVEWAKRYGWKLVPIIKQVAETVWHAVTEWVMQTVRSWLGWIWGWVTKWVQTVVYKPMVVYRNVTEMVWQQVEQWVPVVKRVARTVYEDVTEWITVTKPIVETVYEEVRQTVYRWVERPVTRVKKVVKTVWQTGKRLVEKVVPVEREIIEYVES